MERYRSGHNGADSKSVCLNGHAGSNPALSAKKKNRALARFFLFVECGSIRTRLHCVCNGYGGVLRLRRVSNPALPYLDAPLFISTNDTAKVVAFAVQKPIFARETPFEV